MYEDEHIYLTTFMYNIGKKLAGFGTSEPDYTKRNLQSFNEEPMEEHHHKHGKHHKKGKHHKYGKNHHKMSSMKLKRLGRVMCFLPLVFICGLIFVHLWLMSSFHCALLEDEAQFEAKWTVFQGQDLPGHDAEVIQNWRDIK
jgi:hypothetical protein